MARSLRHVTIPDHHNRIGALNADGLARLAASETDQIKEGVRALVSRLVLDDNAWAVLYAMKDELMERGEWDDSLTVVVRKKR